MGNAEYMGSHQMVSHSASQSSSAIQQQRSTSSNRQVSSSNNSNSGAIAAASDSSSSQHNGYGSVLQKSKSGSLVQESTDSMLKEMDNALKASSNFIETHRSSSSSGPNSIMNTDHTQMVALIGVVAVNSIWRDRFNT